MTHLEKTEHSAVIIRIVFYYVIMLHMITIIIQ